MENFEMWIVGYGIVYDTAFGPDIGFVRFEITKPQNP